MPRDGFTTIVVRKIKFRYGIVSNYAKARVGNLACGYTVKELAKLTAVDPSWIYHRIRLGDIRIAKDRRFGCYLFPRNEATLGKLRRLKNKEIRHVTIPEEH